LLKKINPFWILEQLVDYIWLDANKIFIDNQDEFEDVVELENNLILSWTIFEFPIEEMPKESMKHLNEHLKLKFDESWNEKEV
jgi:hypothetical protein